MALRPLAMRCQAPAPQVGRAGRMGAAPLLPSLRARSLAPAHATRRAAVCSVVCSAAASLGAGPGMMPPAQAYQKIVDLGAGKAKLDAGKTFLFGILAGAYVGLGALLCLTVGGACPGILQANPGLQKIVLGTFGLPFGLLLVINCGAELFTGNTALVTAALYEGKATWGELAKNWLFSYLGNLLGAIGLVTILVQAGTIGSSTALGVAAAKTSLTFGQAFLRGILANWLVCLAVWLATAASSLPGKVIGVWMPISAFVAFGFEHSVANMFFIPFSMASGSGITAAQFLTSNLIPVTLGNIVGGAFCVATIYSALYGKLGNNGN